MVTFRFSMILPILFLFLLTSLLFLPAVGHAQQDAPASLKPEMGEPEIQFAPQINNNFALDLYGQIAQENEGKNLFFSPYSILSALTMTAEGARGETALQMGTVLRFPEEARRSDNKLVPWDTTSIHTEMTALKALLLGGTTQNTEQDKKQRHQIERLDKELQSLNQQLRQQRKEPGRRQNPETVQRALTVRQELEALRQQIDQYEINIAS